MSLLLDALKRAAQEKLEKQRQDAAAQPSDSGESLSLEIADTQYDVEAAEKSDSDSLSSTDDLRQHRADVLASELQAFMGGSNTERERAGHADDRHAAVQRKAEAMAAQSYTPAVTPTPAAAARLFKNKRAGIMQSKKGILIAVSGAGVLLIAVFYIISLNNLDRSNVLVHGLEDNAARSPVADAPADNTKIEAGLLVEQEPIGTLLDETPAVGQEEASIAAASATDSTQPTELSAGQQAVPASIPERAPAPRTTVPRLSVQKSRQEPLHDILLRAYSAYQANDLAAAEAGYRQALARAPSNRDALLGFAATAIQRGDYAAAMETYTQLLNLDPNDDLALAGISGLKQGVQGVSADESMIKRLLLKRPESAQLHFALGNLYSASADWPKAQSAYFDAHHFDAQNPDYAYNLAISLEHLQQAAAALRYYELALTLAGARKSNFNSAQAATRIAILQAQNSPTDAR